ncbi:MAG: FN3 associated domain-containing protein, partial [Salinispira sp.]
MWKLSRVLVIIIFFLSHIPLYGQFVLSHEPGTYNSDVILEIIPEIEYENIFYRFPSYEESQWFNYEQPIVLSADKGSQRFYPLDLLFVNDRQIVDYRILEYTIDKKSPTQSFELTLYTVDDVSNRSLPGIAQFDIDRRDEVIVDAIPIISPVEGDFANPQLLYIDDREFSQLRYTTDGSDPALDGTIYEEAVLLLAASYVKLRVYGETRDGRKLHKTIRYRAGNHEYRQLKQGRTTEDVYVVPIKAGLFYRTKDVHSAKLSFNAPVRFETEPGKLKTSLIRIIDGDREYRYFFVLDNRPPENPRANLLPPLPVYADAVDDENTMLSTVHAEPVHPPLNTENRIPKKPLLTGIPDTGVMSGNMFLLQIVDPLPNLEYFYSIGNSTVHPANPATSGKRAYSHIPIHIGSDIQSETIIIGLIAVLSTNKNYRSPVNYVRFQVDNRLPEEPGIQGVRAGAEYSESIAFSIDSGEGDTVFYQLSENGTKTNYMLYDAPKLLQGEEGKRVVYSLSAYSENTLGTRSNSVELGFAIDREAPEFPPMHISINNKEVDSQTLSIISSSAVTISFDTDDDVAYEFSRGSDPLPEIFPYSPLVHGYLTLDIPENSEAQFNLRFRPIDFAGNFGPLSGEYT